MIQYDIGLKKKMMHLIQKCKKKNAVLTNGINQIHKILRSIWLKQKSKRLVQNVFETIVEINGTNLIVVQKIIGS
jgi:division protein CdvB (Snf7/Vps24/ESCRT-III family)